MGQYILKLTEESNSRTRWAIYVENIEIGLTTLNRTIYTRKLFGLADGLR